VLLGYSIFRFPLLDTICSAVKGLLVYLQRESDHHFFTAATSSRKSFSSRFGSTATLAMLLNAMMLMGTGSSKSWVEMGKKQRLRWESLQDDVEGETLVP
jgi:hypothetical protein